MSKQPGSLFGMMILSMAFVWGAFSTPAAAVSYEQRNSTAALTELADAFFPLVDLDHPSLTAVKAAYEAGQPVAALDAYRTYFLDKLRDAEWFWPIIKDPDLRYPETGKQVDADNLMNNRVTIDGDLYDIGQPGSIDWSFGMDWYTTGQYEFSLLEEGHYFALAEAYLELGSTDYLTKWNAFLNDMMLNFHGLDPRYRVDSTYTFDKGAATRALNALLRIARIAQTQSDDSLVIESGTLARYLMRIIRQEAWRSMTMSWIEPQNHSTNQMDYTFALGLFLDDFYLSDEILEGAMRAAGHYAYDLNYRDGTEFQRDLHYNPTWVNWGPGQMVQLFRQPNLAPTVNARLPQEWRDWLDEQVKRRLKGLTWNLDGYGRFAPGINEDWRNRAASIYNWITESPFSSELLADPDIAAMMLRRNDASSYPSHPSFLSDYFPYGGYTYMRLGWQPYDSYGFLFCGKTRSDGFRINANNIFGLWACGRSMVEAPYLNAYTQVPSPVLVDDMQQNGNAGILHIGHHRVHKNIDQVNPYRWHTSTRYDVTEGLYNGRWGGAWWGTPEDIHQGLLDSFDGTAHHRMVLASRLDNLWFVIDRMTADSPHSYTVDWCLPSGQGTAGNAANFKTFELSEINLDSANRTLTTQASSLPNVSLYQDTPAPIVYSSAVISPGTRCGYYKLSAKINGITGGNPFLTMICPRQTGVSDSPSVTPYNEIPSYQVTYLSGLVWTSDTMHGGTRKDLDYKGGLIDIDGTVYPKGISTHARSETPYGEVVYDIGGAYTVFKADIGVDGDATTTGSVTFQVWLDGVQVYDSPLMRKTDAAIPLEIDVTGVNVLKLIVTDGGNDNNNDHAVWGDARLINGDEPGSGQVSGSIVGFDTTLLSGTNIIVRTSAADGGETLTAGSVSISGEALLQRTTSGGSVTGVALGCASFSINGTPQAIPCSDFEFTISASSLTNIIPILTPIEKVTIAPAAKVFTESIEVTLSCPTPGVEIRYTLDGSEPTHTSTLYTGPFVLTQTVTFRVRAVRPGMGVMPKDHSATKAGPLSWASFRRDDSLRPAVAAENTVPGLKYHYYEDTWEYLAGPLDLLEPLSSGTAANLFDISARLSEGPFGFRYSGYLTVPADGVYTFHAPAEYIQYDLDAGYHLRVIVAGERLPLEVRDHGRGTASVPLRAGAHEFIADYADLRGAYADITKTNAPFRVYFDRTGTITGKDRSNFPTMDLPDFIWSGITPVLEISGPSISRQPVPASWLSYDPVLLCDGQTLLTFAVFSEYWFEPCNWPQWCEGMDENKSGTVDLTDLISFISRWMACENP